MHKIQNVHLSFDAPVLRDIEIELNPGELTLLAGPTGSGKSTLLALLAGLMPTYIGGQVSGQVETNNHLFALVQQAPAESFLADQVELEICFGLEHLSREQQMLRLESAIGAVDIADLRHRQLHTLSSGEAQRVAIAAALARKPDVLLLDEPTSSLDPVAAEEILLLLQRLAHEEGLTVLFSEHRIDRALHFADSVLLIEAGSISQLRPRQALERFTPAPASVQIARAAGLSELPLTVDEARAQLSFSNFTPEPAEISKEVIASMREVAVKRESLLALKRIDLEVHRSEIVGVLGKNGAGKSTLLHTFFGDLTPTQGSVNVAGLRPHELEGNELLRQVALVPHNPIAMLIDESVQAALQGNDKRRQFPSGTTQLQLGHFTSEIDIEKHPRQLSEGQRLLVALAMATAGKPALLLLDEPTRGLDQEIRTQFISLLKELATSGTAIVIATHDLDWAAEICDSAILLSDGQCIHHGDASSVMTKSQLMSPTVAQICWPLPIIRLSDAIEALA